MKHRTGWSSLALVLVLGAGVGPFGGGAAAQGGPWDSAAASSGLTALYAFTTATGPTTRSIEVQLFGTVFPGAISQPKLLLESDTASGLCPVIEFIPERHAFAVVYSRFEPTGITSADVSLQVALVSASTGRVITSGTLLQRSVINVNPNFRPQAGAFCPRAAYLTESRRLLVTWVVRRLPVVSEAPLVWDAADEVATSEDAFWGLHFDPLQRDCAHPQPLRLGPDVIFTRRTSEIRTFDIAYAPKKATGWKSGNVLAICSGMEGLAFPEQANFFTFRADGLHGVTVSEDGWPTEVADGGFCGGGSAGPGCLPNSVYSAVAFQSGMGFGPPRFALATADQLFTPPQSFATLFFVPPTCDAAACPLTTPGKVALAGDDAVMFDVNVEEAPCRIPGSAPGSTRASSCAYVVFRFRPDTTAGMEWGITAFGYGVFAAFTPAPEDWLPLGELPGLEREVGGPTRTAIARLTRSTLPFAPAIAVLYSVIRERDGIALDEFPRPYLIRLNTAGDVISPTGEAGFID